MNYGIFFYYRSHSKALKIISSLFCTVSALQFLWVSHDGMRINVIHYEPLTLSLRFLIFFFQQSHWFLKLRNKHDTIRNQRSQNLYSVRQNNISNNTFQIADTCTHCVPSFTKREWDEDPRKSWCVFISTKTKQNIFTHTSGFNFPFGSICPN